MTMVVSYGGGVNSTAVLVGMVERGIRPDAILFADTGGEHPQGLGRSYSWRAVAAADDKQCQMFSDSTSTPCGCWDGTDKEDDDDDY